MLYDRLTHASLYRFSNARLTRGLDWLAAGELAARPPGRYELEGDKLFAVIAEYPTRPAGECVWEAHRNYVDIQFVAAGVEGIEVTPLDATNVVRAYDAATDMTTLAPRPGAAVVSLALSAGEFAVFFPHDAHRPGLRAGGVTSAVRKVVVKVAVE